jgi:hypothetical protein
VGRMSPGRNHQISRLISLLRALVASSEQQEVLLRSLQMKKANECTRNDTVAVPSELSALLSLLSAPRHPTLSHYRPRAALPTGLSRVAHRRVSLRHPTLPLLFVQDQVAADVSPRRASRALPDTGEGMRPSRGRVLTPQRRDQGVPRRGRGGEESVKEAYGPP